MFAILTTDSSSDTSICGVQIQQAAPWNCWDNKYYTQLADGYYHTPSGTLGCLALLGNPDISAEKGMTMAMANMISDFFTPPVYPSLIGLPVPFTYACTEENTCNFNSDVNINDGSCIGFDVVFSSLTIEDRLTVTTAAIMPIFSWTPKDETIEVSSAELLPIQNGKNAVTVTNLEGTTITASQNVADVSLIELISEQVIF